MIVNLTIQEYAHLRAIVELEGKCEGTALSCEQCPLQLGYDVKRSSYNNKECIDTKLRFKIAASILKLDNDVKELMVIENL
jgi:hypothetical protein